MADKMTPGPWQFRPKYDGGQIENKAGTVLAWVARHQNASSIPLVSAEEVVANARAITALPDLIVAATLVEEWIDRALVPAFTARKPMPENLETALAALRAALAKAGVL